mgnify:CR=1 FL=1
MSETALIFFIISFGLIAILDILFIIHCIIINSKLNEEYEDERDKRFYK